MSAEVELYRKKTNSLLMKDSDEVEMSAKETFSEDSQTMKAFCSCKRVSRWVMSANSDLLKGQKNCEDNRLLKACIKVGDLIAFSRDMANDWLLEASSEACDVVAHFAR